MAQERLSAKSRRHAIRDTLDTRLISEPLRGKINNFLTLLAAAETSGAVAPDPDHYEVILEVNLNNPLGRSGTRDVIFTLLGEVLGPQAGSALAKNLPESTHPYVFAYLTGPQIIDVAESDTLQAEADLPLTAEEAARRARGVYLAIEEAKRSGGATPAGTTASTSSSRGPTETSVASRTVSDAEAFAPHGEAPLAAAAPATATRGPGSKARHAIFRIWESQKVHPLTTESIQTVRARPAHNSFGALGEGVVWAVLDSGVDKGHPHFKTFSNLILPAPLTDKSCSFKSGLPWDQDGFGHGTHVAGIICGQAADTPMPIAAIQAEGSTGDRSFHLQPVPGIRGMAPKAKLLIVRVLDDDGDGTEADVIQAIEYIQQLNDYGRHVVVHGANISVGLFSDPTWYACGQTPLCREINRLTKSGVAVVVAAGNTGYGESLQMNSSVAQAGQTLSINDPGNADLAITVGSTHRSSPHTFGISYFSSKGPTSDGRSKPDVVAPGEKIISAASSQKAKTVMLDGLGETDHFDYLEDTGTSMAAPHVSGVLAAFLSIKREYMGEPDKTKELLKQSAMDLHRDPNFQGAGLVDLLKLIQSV
jgi:serine protease AprX